MIIQGDARFIPLQDESVQCCVTSPPYYGLRDYGVVGQIGLEKSPDEYVQELVQVFREVRRVLKKDGCIWVNLGDSYNGSGPSGGAGKQYINIGSQGTTTKKIDGLKQKDLIGIPWRVAFALQADGWYLRQDIIWSKPNPMPESVTDRCTKAHEYVFLLSKNGKYFYDAEAIKEPIKDASVLRLMQNIDGQTGSARVPGKTNGNMKAVRPFGITRDRLLDYNSKEKILRNSVNRGSYEKECDLPLTPLIANKKSVWQITTRPYKHAHFATMPEKLVEPCILAGSKPGDVILDPFGGSMTVGKVAERHGREFVGIELNWDYIGLGKKRLGHNQRLLI